MSTTFETMPFPVCNTCEKPYAGTLNLWNREGAQFSTVEKLSRCAKCHITPYCSQDCQKADWKNHKTICKEPPQGADLKKYKKLIQAKLVQFGKTELNFCSVQPIGKCFSILRKTNLKGQEIIITVPCMNALVRTHSASAESDSKK